MRVPIDELCSLFCDNKSAIKNSTIHEATFKKKHNAIVYHHKVTEAVASGTVRHMLSSNNLADSFTNPLPHHKSHKFCEKILY